MTILIKTKKIPGIFCCTKNRDDNINLNRRCHQKKTYLTVCLVIIPPKKVAIVIFWGDFAIKKAESEGCEIGGKLLILRIS